MITSVLVAVIVLFAVLLVGVRLFGLQVYTVLSGSMEPAYKTGSLIYVKHIEPSELEVGDVITFKLSENTTATHRIIEIVSNEEKGNNISFKTKGDANNIPDSSLVDTDSVIGTPIFTIPYLGYIANFIQKPPGMYIAIISSVVLILLVFFVDTFTSDEEEIKETKE